MPAIAALASVAMLAVAGCSSSGSASSTSTSSTSTSSTSSSPSSASSASSAKGTTALRVGLISTDPPYGPLYWAQALGYLSQYHVSLQVYSGSQTDCLSGLIGGGVDVCTIDLAPVTAAVKAGATIHAIATIQDPVIDTLNVNGTTIKSWSDLKGKAIAVNTVIGGSTVVLDEMLQAHGVSPQDVTLVPVGGSSLRIAALESGKTAGALSAAPSDFEAANSGYPILGSSQGVTPDIEYIVASDNPSPAVKAALVGLLEGMQRADTFVTNPANKQAVINMISKVSGLDTRYATESYNLLIGDNKTFTQGIAISVPHLKSFSVALGKTGQQVDKNYTQLYTNSYVNEALNDLKKQGFQY